MMHWEGHGYDKYEFPTKASHKKNGTRQTNPMSSSVDPFAFDSEHIGPFLGAVALNQTCPVVLRGFHGLKSSQLAPLGGRIWYEPQRTFKGSQGI